MEVTVKLFATLREGRGKIIPLEYDLLPNLRTITGDLNISQEGIAILLLNGHDAQLEQIPADGDTISIFPPVGGG